jgi:hypothetical protein
MGQHRDRKPVQAELNERAEERQAPHFHASFTYFFLGCLPKIGIVRQ